MEYDFPLNIIDIDKTLNNIKKIKQVDDDKAREYLLKISNRKDCLSETDIKEIKKFYGIDKYIIIVKYDNQNYKAIDEKKFIIKFDSEKYKFIVKNKKIIQYLVKTQTSNYIEKIEYDGDFDSLHYFFDGFFMNYNNNVDAAQDFSICYYCDEKIKCVCGSKKDNYIQYPTHIYNIVSDLIQEKIRSLTPVKSDINHEKFKFEF